jgi:proteasome activator subunit 4
LKATKKKKKELKYTDEQVINRHSAVLMLASAINAHPYEIPEWMPAAIVDVAACASDPSPISTAVNKSLSEFKRTHQDSWHVDAEKFSDDERQTLNDLLLAPSYYI